MAVNFTAASRVLSDKKKVELHKRHFGSTTRRKSSAEGLLPFQKEVKAIYDSWYVQLSIAIVIVINFLLNVILAQWLPVKGKDDRAIAIFAGFEFFFSYVFLIELVVNFYGSFFF